MRWPKACLGEVAQVISGATPKSSVDEYWDGDIPWITPADLSKLTTKEVSATSRRITSAGLASCSSRILPERSVLLSSRAPIGHVAINAVPMATNQGFKSLVPDVDLVTPDFLYWWLKTNTAYLQSLGRGATFKEVSKEIVESIEIPTPPLEEQRRIAAVLDKADRLLQLSRSSIAILHQTLEACFGDLSATISGECVSKKLEEVVEAIIDYRGKSPEKTDEGIPLVTARLVKEGRILDATEFIAPEGYSEWMRRGMPKEGDVVFTTEAPLGQVAQIANPNVALAQRLVLLRGKPQELDNTYLRFALQMKSVSDQIRKRATGSTVMGIRQKELRQVEIPLPDLAAQKDFSRLALAIESKIQHLRQREDFLKSLKESLAIQLIEK